MKNQDSESKDQQCAENTVQASGGAAQEPAVDPETASNHEVQTSPGQPDTTPPENHPAENPTPDTETKNEGKQGSTDNHNLRPLNTSVYAYTCSVSVLTSQCDAKLISSRMYCL